MDEDYRSLAYDGSQLLRVPLCISRANFLFIFEAARSSSLIQHPDFTSTSAEVDYTLYLLAKSLNLINYVEIITHHCKLWSLF